MNPDAQDKINQAIKACLREAYEAELPLAAVTQFLSALRQDPSFDEDEVQLVHAGVRRMLTLLYRRSDEGEFRPISDVDNPHSSVPA